MRADGAAAPAPRAVLFDAYGTLFDVYSVAQRLEHHYPGFGERLSVVWRDKQIEYTRLVSMSCQSRSFRECTRAGLRFAVARHGLPLPTAAEDDLLAAYDRLSPFPENRGVLEALRQRGIRAGVLSNGDPDMLAAVVEHAGFGNLLDPLLSVAACGRFKTDPAAYALGTQALGLPAAEILFVSCNCWDAIGATWFGYPTLWLDRFKLPRDDLGAEPTHTGTSLSDVLALFPSAPTPP